MSRGLAPGSDFVVPVPSAIASRAWRFVVDSPTCIEGQGRDAEPDIPRPRPDGSP